MLRPQKTHIGTEHGSVLRLGKQQKAKGRVRWVALFSCAFIPLPKARNTCRV
jgi:hypothetical protein